MYNVKKLLLVGVAALGISTAAHAGDSHPNPYGLLIPVNNMEILQAKRTIQLNLGQTYSPDTGATWGGSSVIHPSRIDYVRDGVISANDWAVYLRMVGTGRTLAGMNWAMGLPYVVHAFDLNRDGLVNIKDKRILLGGGLSTSEHVLGLGF